MKIWKFALILSLSACGPGGSLSLPGITPSATSTLNQPVNTVERWEVTSAKGDKSQISTVKTGERDYRFDGKFPSSFFGQAIDVPIQGTLSYHADGTATIHYSGPMNATVEALYAISDNGGTVVFTTTSASPAIAPIGDKTTLVRQSVTRPGS